MTTIRWHVLLAFILSLLFQGCSTDDTVGSENVLTRGEVTLKVPEDFIIEMVAGPDLVDYPMFATMDENGRLFVFESTGDVYDKSPDAIENPKFRIKTLEDLDGDGVYDKSTIYADKVGFPQGGVFYKGSLYASSAPDLLKFTDTDGDGAADKREVLLSGWTLNINANSLIGPFMGQDGWLYLTSAIEGFDVTSKEGKRLKGETARIWRVRTDGSGLEWVSAGGMNNPIELTFTRANELIGTETYFTDPNAGQRDALVYWTEGGVYPKPNNNISRDSLPRTGELMPVVTKYSRVTPVGICRYRSMIMGEEFQGDLFSTQFNTHRVVRHKLIRDGGSFRTEDEVFLSSEHEDFHPTDVLEDADGSLLVVETGGWFIKGCPLSQVSKPELEGAIYRIKRKGQPLVSDPYGNRTDWPSMSVKDLIGLLDDERPYVRDRSVATLVDKGEEAIEALAETVRTAPSAALKTRAVFALYRIGGTGISAVRQALSDPGLEVQIAAARCLGLLKDSLATEGLIGLVKTGAPAAKRQAATALGQIKDPRAISALIEAVGEADDRFVEHAMVYSLITINRADLVAGGLVHNNPGVQKASLIALDQMPSGALQAYHVQPFLEGQNEDLKKTALWVASHHPEWSMAMIAYMRYGFSLPGLSEDKKELFRAILLSFSQQTTVQWFIIELLQNSTLERKLFVLDIMRDSPLKEFPPFWKEALGHLITGTRDPIVISRAMGLVRHIGDGGFVPQLYKVFRDSINFPPSVRLEAVSILTGRKKEMAAEYFEYVLSQLGASRQGPERYKAAVLIGNSELDQQQIERVVAEQLDHMDAFVLPLVLPALRKVRSLEAGRKVLEAVSSPAILENYTDEQLADYFSGFPGELKPTIDGLIIKVKEAREGRLAYLKEVEGDIANGDLDNGRLVYFGKAACSECHVLGGEGGTLGPDLTSIQRDRSAHDLVEAIVYPGASLVREYETYKIKTAGGEHTGIVMEETPEAIILGTGPQATVRINRIEIISMEIAPVSMMPQGLDKTLTRQELADLLAFLIGQDQHPERDQKALR